jgi:hypothetical protein
MLTNQWLRPVAATLVLAATGCGDPTEPPVAGTFEAVVSGEYSLDLEGSASFGIFPGEGFGLTLQPVTPGQILGFGHRAESRPAVGSYQLADPATEGAFFALFMNQTPQGLATFTTGSGQLVITESSAARLAGSFDLTARGFLAGDPVNEREVRISGTFSASCAAGARCD